MLKIVRPICCGVDVHKSFIVATIGITNKHGVTTYKTHNFYTHNKDINNFKNFLFENNCYDGIFKGIFKDDMKWDGRGYNKNADMDYEIINGNGIIKEYYCGKLIYEGECLRGKRNGKGKEYNFLTGKIKYEGEFIDGIKMC